MRSGTLAGLALGVAFALSSGAARADAGKVNLFVHNFKVSKKLEADGSVFASSVCTNLLKDKTLEVLCEDDMSASLAHSSQIQMFGTTGGDTKRVGAADRLDQVKVLVHGKVTRGTHGLILDVTVWERDPTFEGEILKVRRQHGHIRIKGIQGGVGGVFTRLERLVPRIAALSKEPPKGPVPAGDMR
jgi:hypothetical protein